MAFRKPDTPSQSVLDEPREPQKDGNTDASLDLFLETLENDARKEKFVVPQSPLHASDSTLDIYSGLDHVEEAASLESENLSKMCTSSHFKNQFHGQQGVQDSPQYPHRTEDCHFASPRLGQDTDLSDQEKEHDVGTSHRDTVTGNALCNQEDGPGPFAMFQDNNWKGANEGEGKIGIPSNSSAVIIPEGFMGEKAGSRGTDEEEPEEPTRQNYQTLLKNFKIMKKNFLSLCYTAKKEVKQKDDLIVNLRKELHSAKLNRDGDMSPMEQTVPSSANKEQVQTGVCVSVQTDPVVPKPVPGLLEPAQPVPACHGNVSMANVCVQTSLATTSESATQTSVAVLVEGQMQTDSHRIKSSSAQTVSPTLRSTGMGTVALSLTSAGVQTPPKTVKGVSTQSASSSVNVKSVQTDTAEDREITAGSEQDQPQNAEAAINMKEVEKVSVPRTEQEINEILQSAAAQYAVSSHSHGDELCSISESEVSRERKRKHSSSSLDAHVQNKHAWGSYAQEPPVQTISTKSPYRSSTPENDGLQMPAMHLCTETNNNPVMSSAHSSSVALETNVDSRAVSTHAEDERSSVNLRYSSYASKAEVAADLVLSDDTDEEEVEKGSVNDEISTVIDLDASFSPVEQKHITEYETRKEYDRGGVDENIDSECVQGRTTDKHIPEQTIFRSASVDSESHHDRASAKIGNVYGPLKNVFGEAWRKKLLLWPVYVIVSRKPEIDSVFYKHEKPKIYDWQNAEQGCADSFHNDSSFPEESHTSGNVVERGQMQTQILMDQDFHSEERDKTEESRATVHTRALTQGHQQGQFSKQPLSPSEGDKAVGTQEFHQERAEVSKELQVSQHTKFVEQIDETEHVLQQENYGSTEFCDTSLRAQQSEQSGFESSFSESKSASRRKDKKKNKDKNPSEPSCRKKKKKKDKRKEKQESDGVERPKEVVTQTEQYKETGQECEEEQQDTLMETDIASSAETLTECATSTPYSVSPVHISMELEVSEKHLSTVVGESAVLTTPTKEEGMNVNDGVLDCDEEMDQKMSSGNDGDSDFSIHTDDSDTEGMSPKELPQKAHPQNIAVVQPVVTIEITDSAESGGSEIEFEDFLESGERKKSSSRKFLQKSLSKFSSSTGKDAEGDGCDTEENPSSEVVQLNQELGGEETVVDRVESLESGIPVTPERQLITKARQRESGTPQKITGAALNTALNNLTGSLIWSPEKTSDNIGFYESMSSHMYNKLMGFPTSSDESIQKAEHSSGFSVVTDVINKDKGLQDARTPSTNKSVASKKDTRDSQLQTQTKLKSNLSLTQVSPCTGKSTVEEKEGNEAVHKEGTLSGKQQKEFPASSDDNMPLFGYPSFTSVHKGDKKSRFQYKRRPSYLAASSSSASSVIASRSSSSTSTTSSSPVADPPLPFQNAAFASEVSQENVSHGFSTQHDSHVFGTDAASCALQTADDEQREKENDTDSVRDGQGESLDINKTVQIRSDVQTQSHAPSSTDKTKGFKVSQRSVFDASEQSLEEGEIRSSDGFSLDVDAEKSHVTQGRFSQTLDLTASDEAQFQDLTEVAFDGKQHSSKTFRVSSRLKEASSKTESFSKDSKPGSDDGAHFHKSSPREQNKKDRSSQDTASKRAKFSCTSGSKKQTAEEKKQAQIRWQRVREKVEKIRRQTVFQHSAAERSADGQCPEARLKKYTIPKVTRNLRRRKMRDTVTDCDKRTTPVPCISKKQADSRHSAKQFPGATQHSSSGTFTKPLTSSESAEPSPQTSSQRNIHNQMDTVLTSTSVVSRNQTAVPNICTQESESTEFTKCDEVPFDSEDSDLSTDDSNSSDSLTDPDLEGSCRTRLFLYYRDPNKFRPELEMSLEDEETESEDDGEDEGSSGGSEEAGDTENEGDTEQSDYESDGREGKYKKNEEQKKERGSLGGKEAQERNRKHKDDKGSQPHVQPVGKGERVTERDNTRRRPGSESSGGYGQNDPANKPPCVLVIKKGKYNQNPHAVRQSSVHSIENQPVASDTVDKNETGPTTERKRKDTESEIDVCVNVTSAEDTAEVNESSKGETRHQGTEAERPIGIDSYSEGEIVDEEECEPPTETQQSISEQQVSLPVSCSKYPHVSKEAVADCLSLDAGDNMFFFEQSDAASFEGGDSVKKSSSNKHLSSDRIGHRLLRLSQETRKVTESHKRRRSKSRSQSPKHKRRHRSYSGEYENEVQMKQTMRKSRLHLHSSNSDEDHDFRCKDKALKHTEPACHQPCCKQRKSQSPCSSKENYCSDKKYPHSHEKSARPPKGDCYGHSISRSRHPFPGPSKRSRRRGGKYRGDEYRRPRRDRKCRNYEQDPASSPDRVSSHGHSRGRHPKHRCHESSCSRSSERESTHFHDTGSRSRHSHPTGRSAERDTRYYSGRCSQDHHQRSRSRSQDKEERHTVRTHCSRKEEHQYEHECGDKTHRHKSPQRRESCSCKACFHRHSK